jgi:hypothetical protein
VQRNPALPLLLQKSPCTPIKGWELQPPHLGEKTGIWHHNTNPARSNIPSIHLSEEHCWSSRRKILKTPTRGAQRIKTLTKTDF